MTSDRMGQQYLTWEVLLSALRLPENTDLVELKMDHITGSVILYLRSPNLPERHEAAYPTIVNAVFKTTYFDCEHTEQEFVEWSY